MHDYGTSAEYRDVLNLLGLTQAEMAELLGVSVRTAHGYANGARIPEPVARFLRDRDALGAAAGGVNRHINQCSIFYPRILKQLTI